MTSWPASQQHSRAGRLYMMFWADCSPLLPVSGSAIVARAEWMGSEPERVLNKTPLVSNKRLECILNCAVFTGGWHITDNTRTSTQSHTRKQKRQSTPSKHPRKQALLLPSPSPPSSLLLPLSSLLPHPRSFLSPLSLQKWRAARLDSGPVGVVSSNRISWERAWRHASLPPSAVIIEIHYTLKMELLEPNYCRLNYFWNTLQPRRILIICSCSHHFLLHPLVLETVGMGFTSQLFYVYVLCSQHCFIDN